MQQGKVCWQDGTRIIETSAYQPGKVVHYYREVAQEPNIPFRHQVIYQDQHIVVVDKPHFLPVTPGGAFVQECLLQRLKNDLEQTDIVPVHRLDRDTAGLVMFSRNAKSRAQYFALFADKKINKAYLAVAKLSHDSVSLGQQKRIANRIEVTEPRFIRRQTNQGQINAISEIQCIAQANQLGLFTLRPITGKTHQLRLHMLQLSNGILNDRFYPELQAKTDDDFSQPLQLLAQSLAFTDPISGQSMQFSSELQLKYQHVF